MDKSSKNNHNDKHRNLINIENNIMINIEILLLKNNFLRCYLVAAYGIGTSTTK